MKSRSVKSVILGTAAAVAMAGGASVSTPAVAQQLAVEEIVVTARQRNESLQDIPLAITAFSAADIERAGFNDLGDIAQQTAGLAFETRLAGTRAGRIDSLIRIRGVTGAGGTADHVAPASLFVDGVFMLGNANVIGLGDLERVEVIKGPQSAFFGRNTFAGAINYVTKNPSLEEYENRLSVTAGTYDNFDVNASFNGPLVEGKLGYSLNARLYHKGAEWTANDGGELGKEATRTVSGVLYGEPTEDSSFKLRVMYQKDDDGPAVAPWIGTQTLIDANTCAGQSFDRLDDAGNPITITPAQNGLAPYWCGDIPKFGDQFGPTFSSETSLFPQAFTQEGRLGFIASPLQLLFGPQPNFLRDSLVDSQFVANTPLVDKFGMERYQKRVAFTGDVDFWNGHTLTVIAGYNESGVNFIRDYDRTDQSAWYNSDPKYAEDYSIEARVNSPQDNRLRWLAGATFYDQTFIQNGGGGLLVANCTASLLSGGCDTSGPGLFTLPATSGNDAQVWAVYGSLSYDITDEITLDLEARYSEDERTVLSSGFLLTDTYKEITPRVILSYQPTDDTNLYVQASRGILPGVTNGLVATCSPNAFTVPYIDPFTGQPSTASECDQFASQTPGGELLGTTPAQKLDALETGWKQRLMDGRIQFNAAVYYYKWKNVPFPLTVTFFRDDEDPALRDGIPNAFANTLGISVSGSQELYGLEVESGIAITENWDAQLNFSYQKNEWTEFLNRSTVQSTGLTNMKGLSATRYPKWQANLTTTYQDELNADWDWFIRADFIYSGEYYLDLPNLMRGPDYFLTHARAGISTEDLRVEFYVRNLFDTKTWLGAGRGVDFGYDAGNFNFTRFQGIAVNPQQKRQFGIRSSIDF